MECLTVFSIKILLKEEKRKKIITFSYCALIEISMYFDLLMFNIIE